MTATDTPNQASSPGRSSDSLASSPSSSTAPLAAKIRGYYIEKDTSIDETTLLSEISDAWTNNPSLFLPLPSSPYHVPDIAAAKAMKSWIKLRRHIARVRDWLPNSTPLVIPKATAEREALRWMLHREVNEFLCKEVVMKKVEGRVEVLEAETVVVRLLVEFLGLKLDGEQGEVVRELEEGIVWVGKAVDRLLKGIYEDDDDD
ncbi:hypothetical protein P280DRAFT_476807 [Massarina eburnea CBS 473.64]|uniref:Uncharacterized protein n=1 Tax=Massarina eburnea CBS 473.64 TaxID=1395130 RepID=A0A6A6SAD2_9PLEO|nr:hypothetical protein P280DRAFT_476807 [Massarina eburnea CBS 473.64]